MELRITNDEGMVMQVGSGENILLPTNEKERETVFELIARSLAHLAYIKPPFAAMEFSTEESETSHASDATDQRVDDFACRTEQRHSKILAFPRPPS
jgi:hypothetical protein